MKRPSRSWLGLGVAILCLLIMTFKMAWLEPLFQPLVSNKMSVIYSRDSFIHLLAWHLAAVLMAISAATLLAVSVGMLVTRQRGAEFLPLARAVANLGQTFPPVAILPTLVALFLYGMLPIFENTVTGLQQVSPNIREAAQGMGMTASQQLWRVEIPLALPMILAGIRIALVISVGTATIGSTVAAKGLGEVIIAGLLTDNMAFVLQGGIMVALIAIIIDALLQHVEQRLTPPN